MYVLFWKKRSDDLTTIFILQIVFEGVKGNGALGDIAFDDVMLTNGNCPNLGRSAVVQLLSLTMYFNIISVLVNYSLVYQCVHITKWLSIHVDI